MSTGRPSGWWDRLRAVFGLRELDEEVERRLEAEHEAEIERACHDPFRFRSWEDFRRFRRGRGKRTRGDHPRYPW